MLQAGVGHPGVPDHHARAGRGPRRQPGRLRPLGAAGLAADGGGRAGHRVRRHRPSRCSKILDTTDAFTADAVGGAAADPHADRGRPHRAHHAERAAQARSRASAATWPCWPTSSPRPIPDLRRLIATGPRASAELSGLLRESGNGISRVVAEPADGVARGGAPAGRASPAPRDLSRSGLQRILRGARRRHGAPRSRGQHLRPLLVRAGLRRHPATPRERHRTEGR